eukprot:TRINITY_DN6344_c0_g1_i2.p1 TRINITY_DN6344_c0_g1~~TRINITY_DN6344_c0_g1_i2.p1  ORF type:complete len:179 (-),score=44.54 TRINITY_DN6344_c0_g1_i2:44-580(-)
MSSRKRSRSNDSDRELKKDEDRQDEKAPRKEEANSSGSTVVPPPEDAPPPPPPEPTVPDPPAPKLTDRQRFEQQWAKLNGTLQQHHLTQQPRRPAPKDRIRKLEDEKPVKAAAKEQPKLDKDDVMGSTGNKREDSATAKRLVEQRREAMKSSMGFSGFGAGGGKDQKLNAAECKFSYM